MLEKSSIAFGKLAAENNKPCVPNVDKEFNEWAADMAKQMELEGEDLKDFWHHMDDCWNNGYDSYKDTTK